MSPNNPNTPRRSPRIRPQVLVPLPTVPTSPAAARRAGEALIVDITKRRKRIAVDFYEIGVSLQKLSRKPMYHALGYANFNALLSHRRLMGRVQAYKLVTVVEAYPKALALHLGVEKGYALVRYTAVTPAADVARQLAQANVKIGGKRIKAMTVTDLRNATKQITAAPRPTDAETRNARGIARRLQQMLRRQGAPSAVVRAERAGAKWKLRLEVDLDEGEVLGGRG